MRGPCRHERPSSKAWAHRTAQDRLRGPALSPGAGRGDAGSTRLLRQERGGPGAMGTDCRRGPPGAWGAARVRSRDLTFWGGAGGRRSGASAERGRRGWMTAAPVGGAPATLAVCMRWSPGRLTRGLRGQSGTQALGPCHQATCPTSHSTAGGNGGQTPSCIVPEATPSYCGQGELSRAHGPSCPVRHL